ncbi:MAG: BON domain-containing protein [Spartobacteria bacterium]|nr:BON domain-containing protein [Spartobacteria bacterium]
MKRTIPFLILSALLSWSGCAALEGQDLAAEPTSDDGIAAVANSRLNDDAVVGRAMLSVTVDNGLAILYGTVPDEAARQRALHVVRGTPGVYDVLDRTRKR